jgi:hypothetical protein
MSYNKEAAKDRKKGTALLPAMGFILIVALGVISWFLAPSVQTFLVRRLNADITGPEFRYVVAFAMFIIFVMVVGLLYAIAIPKPRDQVKDMDIAKERKEIQLAKEERKARRRKITRENRKG